LDGERAKGKFAEKAGKEYFLIVDTVQRRIQTLIKNKHVICQTHLSQHSLSSHILGWKPLSSKFGEQLAMCKHTSWGEGQDEQCELKPMIQWNLRTKICVHEIKTRISH